MHKYFLRRSTAAPPNSSGSLYTFPAVRQEYLLPNGNIVVIWLDATRNGGIELTR